LATGCGKSTSIHESATSDVVEFREPPNAMGFVGEKEILLIKGSYRWDNAIADALEGSSPSASSGVTSVRGVQQSLPLSSDLSFI